ncbi:hypothetical protein DACRYDRAFT_119493 [Dacryopinax primogenitus]|uniref:MYND-type domain-containing protein n=1 Tax=Dacryopinax primogenitus (strain DJM 731) TaxID=1858805 RepID=M5FR69_DACPD|nr:uncharacterized protein DACRYDRAFT_119493 [Dacryopinax primogenitus]EJT97384.1 hypothetical protein DACRYDRAFT_119493 [Dacryopinax primogenitus]
MFGGSDFKPKSIFFHTTIMGSQNQGDRMQIDLNVPCDVEALRADREVQGRFIAESLQKVEGEMKYAGEWTCFACGKQAHELVHHPMSWLQAQPGFVMDYVHMVCSREEPKCAGVIEESNKELTTEMGMEPGAAGGESGDIPQEAPGAVAQEPKAEGKEKEVEKGNDSQHPSSAPPAGGCAVCHKQGKTLQCSRCKTIRYCSPECQKTDYSRHKGVCRWVDNVERSFASEKKEEGENKTGGEDWPAGIPRPFDPPAPAEHDHSNC